MIGECIGPLVAQPIDHGQCAGDPIEVGYLNWRAIEVAIVKEQLQPSANVLRTALAQEGDDLFRVEQPIPLDVFDYLEVAVGEMEVAGRDSLEARPAVRSGHAFRIAVVAQPGLWTTDFAGTVRPCGGAPETPCGPDRIIVSTLSRSWAK